MPTITNYFEFEVSLLGIKPRIWRRFLLRSSSDFHEFHDTIQKAGGWWDYHLYEFRSADGQKRLAVSPHEEPWDENEPAVPVGGAVKLSEYFLQPGDTCIYLYDFGDHWEHLVELKAIQRLPGRTRRHLLGGERAFPHEDCGGIDGYYRCLEAFRISEKELAALEEETREELLSTREWFGNWDPERFDFEEVARLMKLPVRY